MPVDIIGHRGAAGLEPENTLRSFKRALAIGVDMVELDVYVLSTGELVVIHDNDVDRTTDGHGRVLDFSFDDLRKLNAGQDEKIPTLQEVIELVNRRLPMNIELKGRKTAQPVAQLISNFLSRGWRPEFFLVSSFNAAELRRFSKVNPGVRTAICISKKMPLMKYQAVSLARGLRVYSINPDIGLVGRRFIDKAHKNGWRVLVWTVNKPADILRMKSMGVDGIFTDFPDRAKQVLGNK